MKAHLCEEHVSVFSDGQSLPRKYSIWCSTKTWQGKGWKCPSTISTLKLTKKQKVAHVQTLPDSLPQSNRVTCQQTQTTYRCILAAWCHTCQWSKGLSCAVRQSKALFTWRLRNTAAAQTLCCFLPPECIDMCKYHLQSKAHRKNTMLPTFFSLLN